ncbi:MAG: radical SAM protein [Polyangia bacterium]
MIRKRKTGFANPLGTAAALVRNTWVTQRPYLVYYKPTARCDLRCKICSRWKDDSPSEEELSLDQIESFLSTFRKNGAQILVLWGGEPTLRKDLPEILALGKRLGYRISMCTNLNSLAKKSERLLHNLDTLLCSLDGYGAQHDDRPATMPALQTAAPGDLPGDYQLRLFVCRSHAVISTHFGLELQFKRSKYYMSGYQSTSRRRKSGYFAFTLIKKND